MTMDLEKYRMCDWAIPDYLKIWFGDDWIWYQMKKKGYRTGVFSNRFAAHQRSVTVAGAAIQKIIQADIAALEEKGASWHPDAIAFIHEGRKYAGSSPINKILLKPQALFRGIA